MKPSTLQPLEMIRSNFDNRDPAIDEKATGAEALNAYYANHDRTLLKLRPGVEPTIFVVQPLSAMYLGMVIEPLNDRFRAAITAALATCHEIRVPGEAEPMRPDDEAMANGSYGMRVAPAAWGEVVAQRFGLDTLYEIGLASILRAKKPAVPTSG